MPVLIGVFLRVECHQNQQQGTDAKPTFAPIAVVKVEISTAPVALGSLAATVAPKAEIWQTNPPGSPPSVAVKADLAGHNNRPAEAYYAANSFSRVTEKLATATTTLATAGQVPFSLSVPI
jgi:hypothetical protein